MRETELQEFVALAKSGMPAVSQPVVVYTAVFGGYDRVGPVEADDGISYLCFTDEVTRVSPGWTIVQVPLLYRDPRRSAKIFKILPHLFFENVVLSLWIDANMDVDGAFVAEIASQGAGSNGIACCRHSARTCAYTEGAQCIRWGKDEPAIIAAQLAKYDNDGFPRNAGLFQGGFLLRRHNDMQVRALMQAWWHEIENHSVRDQISLPYVLWKARLEPALLDFAVHGNRRLRIRTHHKYRFYGHASLRSRLSAQAGRWLYISLSLLRRLKQR